MKLNRRKRKPKAPPPENSIVLTIRETADELRISHAMVYLLARAKDLDLVKLGAASRITRASIKRLVTHQAQSTEAI
jgi:hypothetical protein